MPARKNRPGKSGTPSLSEIHRQHEETAMRAVRAADPAAYWSADPDILAACRRLAAKGRLLQCATPTAFCLPGNTYCVTGVDLGDDNSWPAYM